MQLNLPLQLFVKQLALVSDRNHLMVFSFTSSVNDNLTKSDLSMGPNIFNCHESGHKSASLFPDNWLTARPAYGRAVH